MAGGGGRRLSLSLGECLDESTLLNKGIRIGSGALNQESIFKLVYEIEQHEQLNTLSSSFGWP